MYVDVFFIDLSIRMLDIVFFGFYFVRLTNKTECNFVCRTSRCSLAVTGAASQRAKEPWRTRILALSSKRS